MKKTKLLFITWTFSLGGGAEKMLSLLTRNLDANKYDIDILEIGKYGDKKEMINSNTTILKPIFNPKKDSKFNNFVKWQLFKISPYLLRKIRTSKKYDYEIAFNYLTPVFCLNNHTKTISWNHGSIFNLKDEPANRKKLEKHLKSVNKIVAISNLTLESINDVYPMYKEKTLLINNGYDFNEIINKSNQISDIEIEGDNLVFIGRIEKNKGIIELLDLFKNVVNILPQKKLYLLGTGDLDDYVKNFINKHKLNNNIFPLGYISNPYPYIKKSAYVIMLSYAEGFPTVFVEGLALGTGFISTPVGGTAELSNNGLCGFVAKDKKELENYIINQLQQKKSCRIINSNTCKNYIKKYDISVQINKFEKLLDEL